MSAQKESAVDFPQFLIQKFQFFFLTIDKPFVSPAVLIFLLSLEGLDMGG